MEKGNRYGGSQAAQIDAFLDYWLESKLHRPINTRYVFREFRGEIDNVDLIRWCADMKQDSIYFLEWEDSFDWNGNLHTLFHSRRNILRIGAIWPFLLSLSRISMDDTDRSRCLRALDSFMWRRAIAGISTRNYDEITLSLLGALPEKPIGELPYSNAIIEQLLDSGDHRIYLWPSDDEVRQKAIDKAFYSEWAARNVRVLLEAIERAIMHDKRPGNTMMSGNLPIEHLMPRTRDERDWPLPVDADESFIQQRDIIIHRLGNLTLVTHGLNSKLP